MHSALYLWAKTVLPHYILSNLGDRMEMSHSVEGRVPFMDHNVAEYLQRVPVSLKIRGMTEKYILREAVQGRHHEDGLRTAEASVLESTGDAASRRNRCTR